MIAVDWGTSNFRAYRVAAGGGVVDVRTAPLGILAVAPGRFASVLDEHVADWLADGAGPVVMCGMVGSRQGWVEVPYVPSPAGLAEIAAGAQRLRVNAATSGLILPGVCCRDAAGVLDVMRGEEIQILGALDAGGDGVYCLPGTHTKFAMVAGQQIVSFRTFMTGELFDVLCRHSILAKTMDRLDGTDDAAFADGVRRARAGGALLHDLFGVRTRALFGELPSAAAASYLSGLLIGHELRDAAPAGHVTVLASERLAALYARALALAGVEYTLPDPVRALTRGCAAILALLREGGH
ncbi:2-dehydro-3-deoxygalactonokinase [bacterium]|nr:MAG: 2-dehydro-3-deoxygalactonokinase [bacterium]